jgi:putative phosphoribosyl transferase
MGPTPPKALDRHEIAIAVDEVVLPGTLTLPYDPRGVVVFAHGSGSGRHSPRNRAVANHLVDAGLATLLIDLLTAEEEAVDVRTAHLRFDIPLLAQRVIGAIDWLSALDEPEAPDISELPVGCFGASTGAAAALIAAADRPGRVGAVVSRGGRPDLAGEALTRVFAPTLLIVGGRDPDVLNLNLMAAKAIPGEVRVEVVPEATHLFEEPGALERVADYARDWFSRYLTAPGYRAD